MSREILFRAYDKVKKKMYYFDLYSIYQDGYMNNEILTRDGCLLEAQGNKNPDVEIQDYTGFKDKNGQRVFEGDVLTIEVRCCPEHYLVSYSKKRACWQINCIGRGNKLNELQDTCGTYIAQHLTQGLSECFEITSNIYQDSHLLKEGK